MRKCRVDDERACDHDSLAVQVCTSVSKNTTGFVACYGYQRCNNAFQEPDSYSIYRYEDKYHVIAKRLPSSAVHNGLAEHIYKPLWKSLAKYWNLAQP